MPAACRIAAHCLAVCKRRTIFVLSLGAGGVLRDGPAGPRPLFAPLVHKHVLPSTSGCYWTGERRHCWNRRQYGSGIVAPDRGSLRSRCRALSRSRPAMSTGPDPMSCTHSHLFRIPDGTVARSEAWRRFSMRGAWSGCSRVTGATFGSAVMGPVRWPHRVADRLRSAERAWGTTRALRPVAPCGTLKEMPSPWNPFALRLARRGRSGHRSSRCHNGHKRRLLR